MTKASQIVSGFLTSYEHSQAWLANEAGIPATTIRNILAGRGATALTIAKLRRVRGLGSLLPEHFVNGSGT